MWIHGRVQRRGELDSEAEDEKDTFWEKNGPFWRTYREILEIDCVSDSAAPPEPQTMSETKYLDAKPSQEKFGIFSKIIFSQYFHKFSTPQNPKFRDLTGLAIWPIRNVSISVWPVWLVRPDLEILDFEVSKF